MLSKGQCQQIIFDVGTALNIKPKLIAERLLNYFDKMDMMAGKINIEALKCSCEVWMDNGMPDYANGKDIPLEKEVKRGLSRPDLRKDHALPRLDCHYSAPFVCRMTGCRCRKERTCR